MLGTRVRNRERENTMLNSPEGNNPAEWKILLVDDDNCLREVNKLVLESAGYRVASVSGGRQALDLLGRASFHVVITDLHMPEIDGLTVLTKAKKLNGNAKVIILTGDHDFEFAFEALQRGADGYLLKPCQVEELKQCVTSCLSPTNKLVSMPAKRNA